MEEKNITKEELFKMTLSDQVKYFNGRLSQGQSMTGACKELGISISIIEKIKKHGYILIDGQYIYQEIKEHENLSSVVDSPEKTQNIGNIEQQEGKVHTSNTKILPQKENITTELIKAKGRPKKEAREKTNITLPVEVKTELQIYCLKNRITLSDLLEQLAKDFLNS